MFHRAGSLALRRHLGGNEHGDSLSVIDTAKNAVVATLIGIPGPHNVQVAPDGQSVWAVSGHENLAVMIDTRSYQVHGTVPTGQAPAHIILTPNKEEQPGRCSLCNTRLPAVKAGVGGFHSGRIR